jgi:hypothetical protein
MTNGVAVGTTSATLVSSLFSRATVGARAAGVGGSSESQATGSKAMKSHSHQQIINKEDLAGRLFFVGSSPRMVFPLCIETTAF